MSPTRIEYVYFNDKTNITEMSYRKRSFEKNGNGESKRIKELSSTDTTDAIARAKARLLEKNKNGTPEQTGHKRINNPHNADTLSSKIDSAKKRLKNQDSEREREEREGKGGLNVEIHPLLRNNAPVRTLPKNHNPLKQNVKKWFDPTAINPYLNQDDMSGPIRAQHRPRTLQFNEQGKYIAKGNELREKLKKEQEEVVKYQETQEKGLTADENLGEHLYKLQYPPVVEWWDRPYLKDRNYNNITDESRLIYDNDIAPISIYIQHPVLIPPPWERHMPDAKPMYLTKKELKRIRRNDRHEKQKDKQDRIKLGLDPPPPPKVKLSNLMNVLTNEAIKDPTAVEMKVREEVEERHLRHMQENEERKLTKEERLAKIQNQHEKNLEKGYYTTVFKIDKLTNPRNFYKIDINAKQLELYGICLLNPKFNLIIVEGGAKSIKFYKRLLMQRIDWTENIAPKVSGDLNSPDISPEQIEDFSGNKCLLLWEGQIKEINFKKWSIMRTSNDDEAFDILNRFGVINYWREALVIDN